MNLAVVPIDRAMQEFDLMLKEPFTGKSRHDRRKYSGQFTRGNFNVLFK